jgi:sugar lactone lactonase YvrE
MIRAEPITEPVAYHGEGPVFSERWGGLRWVDMLAGDVLSLGDDGEVRRAHVGDVAAALRPRRSGGAVIGVERGFALEEPDGKLRRLGELWSGSAVRMNEGACDPDGRFYCGSMSYDRRAGGGAVFRLDPDLSVRVVLEGVTISNGLDWSPDGTLAYYNDTETYRTDVFDYASDTGLAGRRCFVGFEPDQGRPDGLCVDVEGGVWVAMNGAGAVRRYSPDGALEEVVEVPVAKATACTFGGARLDQLFITTSRENLPPEAEPLAGSLCCAEVSVRGQPAREFAG